MPGPGKRLATISEAAEILNISRAMVYKLIKRGEIKCLHIGRSARIELAEIDRFIEEVGKSDEASRG